MADHLGNVHGMSEPEYLIKYPGSTIRIAATLERRKASVARHYGVDNVFQAEEVKAKSKTSLVANYGVSSPMHSPEIRARVASTNLERYGSENVFASSVIQERIRQSNLNHYGVENPNQSPEVMQKRIKTNLARYGFSHFIETADFKEKFEATSIERFGTPHPMKSERGRDLWEESCLKIYRVRHPLSLPSIHEKTQATSRANHGGKYHMSDPKVIEARKKRLLELYGVDNVSKIPAVKEKIIATLRAHDDCRAVPSMNNLEKGINEITPNRVVYTGDWSYWVTWRNGRHKNPDFVVLTVEQLAAYNAGVPISDLRTHLVIEVNGDFWHTRHKNITREKRECEFVEGYASVGVTCLVLWESDFKANPSCVSRQVQKFIEGS